MIIHGYFPLDVGSRFVLPVCREVHNVHDLGFYVKRAATFEEYEAYVAAEGLAITDRDALADAFFYEVLAD